MADPGFLATLHARWSTPTAAVTALVRRATGAWTADLERIVRGYDNEVYRARLTDGRTVYVRIRQSDDHDNAGELYAMDLARHGGVPVPAVLAVETLPTPAGDRAAMVVTEAAGTRLAVILPRLSAEQRRTAHRSLGRTLAVLHRITMPGPWRPDDSGRWPTPEELRRGFIVERRGERPQLLAAGLSRTEVETVLQLSERSPDLPPMRDFVLCHADISPEHVFVDADLQVSALIDWGMWCGSTVIADLAQVAKTHGPDFDAVVEGHGGRSPTDPAFRHAVAVALAVLQIGNIAYHVGIGDRPGIDRNVRHLRRALAMLQA